MKFAYEPDRLNQRAIAWTAAGAVAATAVGVLAAWWVLAGATLVPELSSRLRKSPQSQINAIETNLFSVPSALVRNSDEQPHRLESYGWVDRERGIVHVPIERAFELYLSGRQTVQPAGGHAVPAATAPPRVDP